MSKHASYCLSRAALLAVIGILAGCAGQAPVAEAPPDGACVTDYDPLVDYFPDKAAVTYAENFAVAYFNNYKVITVLDAYDNAASFEYVLVQCGTPVPDAADFPEGTQFIEVPAGSIIAMSTTQLPHLAALGLLDNLAGLDSFDFVNTPEVRDMIAVGELVQIGYGSDVNVELVLETDPDIVMTYGFNPDTDAHPKLIEAGIFTALNAEWRETTPLGRAEWIKYVALFYNAEARAEDAFDKIATAYEEARNLAAAVPDSGRPVVLVNTYSPFDGWIIPGDQTYIGALVNDAGGSIALGQEAPQDSVSLSFEVVYDGARDADIWMADVFGITTLDGLLAGDERYADFAAVQNGNVWNNSLDVNENGGNNYWELGVTNPHLILQDLVAIFHPELLPAHEFRFYERLASAPEQ